MKNNFILKTLFIIFTFAFGINNAFADFAFSEMELRFAQVSDVHLSDAPDTSYKVLSHSKDLMRSAIKDLNTMKGLDFVAFTGDMVNEPTKKLYRDFLLELSDLNYPSLLVLGNHDSTSNDSKSEEYLNKNTVYEIIRRYNPYQDHNSVYFAYSPAKDFRVIVLDTTTGYENRSTGFLSDEQLQFLDKEIGENEDKIIIIFQHHPVIEPFSSSDHKLLNANAYLDVLNKHKHTPIGIFSGHYHCTKIIRKGNVIHVTTPSLVTYPNAYRTVVVSNYRDRVTFDIALHETKLTKIQQLAKSNIIAKSVMYGLASDRNTSILIRKRGLPGIKLSQEEKDEIKAKELERKEADKAQRLEEKQLRKEAKEKAKQEKELLKQEAKKQKELSKGK